MSSSSRVISDSPPPSSSACSTPHGLGDDWPISYEDVRPYYDRVDQLVGVFGSKEGLPNAPDSLYHAPQMKNWRNIIADSLALVREP